MLCWRPLLSKTCENAHHRRHGNDIEVATTYEVIDSKMMRVYDIISERVHKAGYILRHEFVVFVDDSDEEPREPWGRTYAYTPNGDWIGTSRDAHRLCLKRGIQPQKSKPTHCVCSIGFSVKDGKWYGWSHRAMYGFKIGSTCKKGDFHYHGREWTAKTVADAKQMAIDFADGVS